MWELPHGIHFPCYAPKKEKSRWQHRQPRSFSKCLIASSCSSLTLQLFAVGGWFILSLLGSDCSWESNAGSCEVSRMLSLNGSKFRKGRNKRRGELTMTPLLWCHRKWLKSSLFPSPHMVTHHVISFLVSLSPSKFPHKDYGFPWRILGAAVH